MRSQNPYGAPAEVRTTDLWYGKRAHYREPRTPMSSCLIVTNEASTKSEADAGKEDMSDEEGRNDENDE